MKPKLLALSALLSLASVIPAFAAVIIADNFGGTNNSQLNSAAVPTYDSALYSSAPTWVANSHVVYDSNTATLNANNHGNSLVATPNQMGGILSLKADIKLDTAGWIGLAFYTSASSSIFTATNPLTLMLTNEGTVSLRKNSTVDILGTWSIPSFDPGIVYTLELQYNRSAGTANVLLGGSQLNTSAIEIGSLTDSTIGAVGFYVRKATGIDINLYGPEIAEFSYSSIPEPSTAALFFGLMGGLVVGAKRSPRFRKSH